MNDIAKQIVLSGIILCFIGIVEIGIEVFAAPLSTDEILAAEWNTYSYGSPPITLSSPKELRPQNPRIPEQIWVYLQNAESYSYKESDNFVLFVNSATYVQFVTVDVKGAAKGALAEMENVKGISHLKYKESPYKIGKINGIMHNGTLEKNDEIFAFTSVYIVRESTMWQVLLIYRKNDPFGKKIGERILQSLRIESV